MPRSRIAGVRVAFFICGLLSVLVAHAFHVVGMFFPANRQALTVISYTLIVAGIISAVAGVMPQPWARPLFGNMQRPWLQLPFRLLAGFFVTSYLIVAALAILTPSMHLSPLVVYLLCPSCVSSITVTPTLAVSLFLLAPASAAAYGSIGALIGLAIDLLRR